MSTVELTWLTREERKLRNRKVRRGMKSLAHEHPILFSGDMVKAILEGRKTQTRRVIKGTYAEPGSGPYGGIGDRLWVKEMWSIDPNDLPFKSNSFVAYRATDKPITEPPHWGWNSPRFMPRWASRITLEIVKLGWDFLKNISEEDSIAEGAPLGRVLGYGRLGMKSYKEGFIELWDSINTKRGYGWETNPKVWVIEFKRSLS